MCSCDITYYVEDCSLLGPKKRSVTEQASQRKV